MTYCGKFVPGIFNLSEDVGQGGWDVCGVFVGESVHDGSTDIAEHVVHSKCQCGVEFDDFFNQTHVFPGPMVDGDEDLILWGSVLADAVDVMVHPIDYLSAVLDQFGCILWIVSCILKYI